VGQGQLNNHPEGRIRSLLSNETGDEIMWYFAWILGLGLAATVGILNALWYELRTVREKDEGSAPSLPTP
jgi:cyd operon protein YbgT